MHRFLTASMLESQFPHILPPFQAQGQPLGMTHHSREDPTHTLCVKESPDGTCSWARSQLCLIPPPWLSACHVWQKHCWALTSSWATCTQSESKYRHTSICAQWEGKEVTREVEAWLPGVFATGILLSVSKKETDASLFILVVAFPKPLQTATTALATGPPLDRNSHRWVKEQPPNMLRTRPWRKDNAKTRHYSWICPPLLTPLPTN